MKKLVRIDSAYERYADFLKSLPETFDKGGRILHDGRNAVRAYDMPDGGVIVVKSYKKPNLIQKISYTWFRKSKAARAFEYAQTLNERGIRTPGAIACVEVRRGGFLAESYFASAYTDGTSLMVLFGEDGQYDRALVAATAAFLAEMHSKGILHGDLNMTNILVHTNDGGYDFEVIDTNRSRLDRPLPLTEAEIVGNLVRLTHVRRLSACIVAQYALKTGRDPDALVRKVADGLERYEAHLHHRQRLKRFYRELFGIGRRKK